MQRSLRINDTAYKKKKYEDKCYHFIRGLWKRIVRSVRKTHGVKSVIVAGVKVVICFETCEVCVLELVLFLSTGSRLSGALCAIGHNDEFNWTLIINRFSARWLGSRCRFQYLQSACLQVVCRLMSIIFFLKTVLFLLCNMSNNEIASYFRHQCVWFKKSHLF